MVDYENDFDILDNIDVTVNEKLTKNCDATVITHLRRNI